MYVRKRWKRTCIHEYTCMIQIMNAYDKDNTHLFPDKPLGITFVSKETPYALYLE